MANTDEIPGGRKGVCQMMVFLGNDNQFRRADIPERRVVDKTDVLFQAL